MERVSGSATYTLFNDGKSIDYAGHGAAIRGVLELDEDWDLTSSVRYLELSPDGNTLDDYDTIIFKLGMAGCFQAGGISRCPSPRPSSFAFCPEGEKSREEQRRGA